MKIERLIERLKSKNTFRLLIIGNAGYGKTFLATKIKSNFQNLTVYDIYEEGFELGKDSIKNESENVIFTVSGYAVKNGISNLARLLDIQLFEISEFFTHAILLNGHQKRDSDYEYDLIEL